jgi:hypothetical protein
VNGQPIDNQLEVIVEHKKERPESNRLEDPSRRGDKLYWEVIRHIPRFFDSAFRARLNLSLDVGVGARGRVV